MAINDSIVGEKYNKLTVIEFLGYKNRRSIVKCRCDCGSIIDVRTNYIRTGGTKSCGCLNKEKQILNGNKRRIYDYNTDFFKMLTPKSAYIIGLYYSDGTLSKNNTTSSITLHNNDSYLLHKIMLLLSPNKN